ncbi:MAG: hypothetical protein CMJ46_06930 [Planctomyces sp.]|nr:hypothetical protein [Planctomyces sp.]
MATSQYEQPEHQGRTLLKSWFSSILLHLLLFFGLLYWMGSSGTGLGNRNGSLMNFNKVGLEIKTPQIDQFEQRPEDNATPTETVSSEESNATDPTESTDPFDTLPSELTAPTNEESEPVLGMGLPSSVDSTFNNSAPLGDSVVQSPSGDLPAQATAPLGIGESAFMGIRSQGEQVVFLLDRSSSMSGTLLGTKVRPIDVAKAELMRSINSLSGDHEFQIIFYHDDTRALNSAEGAIKGIKMLPVSELNLNLARNFVNQVRAEQGTDHFRALSLALSLHPDVIYFLTDADSKLGFDDINRLRRMSQGTVINCIEFGRGPQLSGTGLNERNFMQRLSDETGGVYRHFNITEF